MAAHAIRKAILLAAGRGTRLGELTARTPKPMLEVAGAPIIGHILSGLAGAGIEEAVVVVGYLAEQLEDFCARFAKSHPGMTIRTLRQVALDGTGGAMLAAEPMVAGEPRFLFGWGDVLMDAEFYRRFVSEARRAAGYDLLLAVNRTRDPYRGAAVYVDAAMRVERIVEKPARGTSTTDWNNAGLFAATPRLFEYTRRLRLSARGELELPLAIAAMVDDRLNVRAVELRGFWSDVGTPEDLARARELFRPRKGAR